MFISLSFTRMAAVKASLVTASGMLLPVFSSMFVRSLRAFPDNCAYKQGGLSCFIEYLLANFLSYDIDSNKNSAFIGFAS